MIFKEFIQLYSDWNGTTVVNDNDLNCIAKGNTWDIAHEEFLLDLEVVSFDFMDNEFCVRVITGREEPKEFTCTDCPYHWADEDEEYPSCHYEGEDNYAPCSYEEPEESYEEDYYYEEESWGYEDRNYQRLYE